MQMADQTSCGTLSLHRAQEVDMDNRSRPISHTHSISTSRPTSMAAMQDTGSLQSVTDLLGPFHGAIAVPLSRAVVVVVVVVVNIDAQAARDSTASDIWREAARCGEWAQHFSNASCIK